MCSQKRLRDNIYIHTYFVDAYWIFLHGEEASYGYESHLDFVGWISFVFTSDMLALPRGRKIGNERTCLFVRVVVGDSRALDTIKPVSRICAVVCVVERGSVPRSPNERGRTARTRSYARVASTQFCILCGWRAAAAHNAQRHDHDDNDNDLTIARA